jgi:hypothetical protein
VAVILRAVDHDGTPDPNVAGLLRQWLAGKRERAVLAAAYEVMSRNPRDPVRYFLRRLESPLPDPDAVPTDVVPASHAPAPRLSAWDAKMAEARAKAAAYKARRAAEAAAAANTKEAPDAGA